MTASKTVVKDNHLLKKLFRRNYINTDDLQSITDFMHNYSAVQSFPLKEIIDTAAEVDLERSSKDVVQYLPTHVSWKLSLANDYDLPELFTDQEHDETRWLTPAELYYTPVGVNTYYRKNLLIQTPLTLFGIWTPNTTTYGHAGTRNFFIMRDMCTALDSFVCAYNFVSNPQGGVNTYFRNLGSTARYGLPEILPLNNQLSSNRNPDLFHATEDLSPKGVMPQGCLNLMQFVLQLQLSVSGCWREPHCRNILNQITIL